MPSSISSTSSFHSTYTASERSDTRSSASGSERNLPSNASLDRLASRLSTAGESYVTAAGSDRASAAGSHARSEAAGAAQSSQRGRDYASAYAAPASEYGSVAGSVYESASSRSLTPAMSVSGSTHSSGSSNHSSPAFHPANSTFGSEASWQAGDTARTMSQAGARSSNASRRSSASSEHHSRGSDWIDMNFDASARGSNASRLSAGSSEHHSRSSDWIDIDPHSTGRSSVAGNNRRSEIAGVLSQAGTPSERSFHLSERGSVVEALGNGRLGYSSASSRRLTSREGSSRPSSVGASSAAGSIAPSYRGSLTPSDRSALRAARRGGRFTGPSTVLSNTTSLDSEYSAYLREGDDVVAPLPPSRFRPAPSAAPSDPYSVASGISSRRIDRTPSLSRRIGESGQSSRFGGADVESLSAAGSGRSTFSEASAAEIRPASRQLWEFLQEEH